MIEADTLNNLILTSYFYHQAKNVFLLRPNENKTIHNLYNETSERIKIIRILIKNKIDFLEEKNGDIRIVK